MQRLALLVLLASGSCVSQAQQWQFDWDWAVSGYQTERRDSDFITPETDKYAHIDSLLDLQIRSGQWNGLFALYSQNLYQNHPQAWWTESDHQWIVRELAWQGSLEIGEQNIDLTLGKIRLDYGVSYAYRPLDMFKPYRQNPIGLSVEEGSLVATASSFDMDGEWTLLYTNSHWTDSDVDAFDRANQQHGAGIRRYGLLGQHEYQLIGYYDDVRHASLGGSWVTVPNQAWEFHTEALWQQQSIGYQLPTHPLQPVMLAENGPAWQVLAGFTYSTESGHSFIGEYWFDERAWSKTDWQQAQRRAQPLNVQSNTQPLASSYAQGLNHYNLTQHNIMLHWSWDTNSWLQWQNNTDWEWLRDITPTLDLLISPQDGGVIATQWFNYQWIDTGNASVDLEFTARFLTGDADSAYAQINDRRTLVFMIRGKF
ncbi:hypothetical protein [Vibrio taketomensis]|uniref:hypothetical protein n=1 Tax=Vibrio taketomensis TaxID=2572923 RepID=UPI00138A61FB|nr:hypothetical protein [Vibrio taketomensis]